jgi:hypothetical protein
MNFKTSFMEELKKELDRHQREDILIIQMLWQYHLLTKNTRSMKLLLIPKTF